MASRWLSTSRGLRECSFEAVAQDLWSGEAVANITVGGEEWEGARWRGIVHSHDNYSFKLTPVTA